MYVEQLSKRTQKSKHFYDADTKKWRAEFTIADRHYKDDFDDWMDIDESIVDDTGGFDKKCDKVRHIFQIAQGGNRRWYPRRGVSGEYVDITGMQYYSNQWRNLNLPAAVWKSNGAEWDMTNLYAYVENTWKRINTGFVLKNSNAPTGLRFEISFTGLTYNFTTGELTSTTDGLVWGYITPETFTDANGLDVPVTTTYDGTYLQWTLDPTGFTYPISNEPLTFTDGYGGNVDTAKDTLVASGDSSNNYGVATYLLRSVNGQDHAGLVEFDLSSISATATCDSATFYVYRYSATTARAYTFNIYSIAVDNADWAEGAKNGSAAGNGEPNWNYRLAGETTAWHGSAGLSTSGEDFEASEIGNFSGNESDAEGTEYSADLTAARVEDWFGAINTNYGIKLHNDAYPGQGSYAACSSDHATEAYRPKLVVEYEEGSVPVITNTVVDVEPVVVVDWC